MRGRESFVFPASLCIRLKRYLLHKPYRPPAPPDDPILLESPILEEPVPEPIALGPLIPAPVWPWIVSGICPDPPNLASPPICGGPPVPYCPITDDDSLPGLIVWLTSAPPGGVILEGPPPIVVSPVGVPVWDPSSCACDGPPVNKSIPLAINIYAHICRNLMEASLIMFVGRYPSRVARWRPFLLRFRSGPGISITLDFFGTSSLGGNRLCRLSNMRKGRSRMLTPWDRV